MALTLVTTPGDATANSYCAVAAATALIDWLPASVVAAWAESSADDQARALAQITARIDQEALDPTTARVTATQALAFPRSPIWNEAGTDLESTTAIPARVVKATAHGAAYLRAWAVAHPGRDPWAAPDQRGMSSLTIGSEFAASFEAGAVRLSPAEVIVHEIVRPLLRGLLVSPGVFATVRG